MDKVLTDGYTLPAYVAVEISAAAIKAVIDTGKQVAEVLTSSRVSTPRSAR